MAVNPTLASLSRNAIWIAFFGFISLGLVAQSPSEGDLSARNPQDYHLVQTGETLWGIAQKYEIAVEELKRLNRLASNNIYSGQRLLIAKGANPSTMNYRLQARDEPAAMITRGDAALPVAAPSGGPASPTEGMLSAEVAPSGEEVWVRHHLRMLNPDGKRAPLIEQSYIGRRDRQLARSRSNTPSNYSPNTSPGARQPFANPTRGDQPGKAQRRVIYHRVRAGETIYSIAAKYNVSHQQIRRWNQKDAVYEGESLRIELDEAGRFEEPSVNLNDIENLLIGEEPAVATEPRNRRIQGTTRSNQRVTQGQTYTFGPFSLRDHEGTFYALHRTHPLGSKIEVAIPGQSGVLELEVVGRLGGGVSVDYGFSPLVVEILEAAGAKGQVAVLKEPEPWTEP